MDDYSESRIELIKRRIKVLKGKIKGYTNLELSLMKESDSIRADGILGLVWRLRSWVLDRCSIIISKEMERCERRLARLEFQLDCSKSIEEITESTRPFDDE